MVRIPSILRRFGFLVATLFAAACADRPAPVYDLANANGRMMDPEAGAGTR